MIELPENYHGDERVKKLLKVRRKLNMLVSLKTEKKTREKSILIIDNDVPRTFTHLEGFLTTETS